MLVVGVRSGTIEVQLPKVWTISRGVKPYLEQCKEIVEKFLNDIYMDDSQSGAQTREEAIAFYTSIPREIFVGCTFDRKISNYVKLINTA